MLGAACRSAFVVLCVLASSEAAHAQTVAEVASKWDLLGTWRLDCSKPASRGNPDLMYAVRGGKLFHDRNFGDTTDSNSVMTATVKGDGSMEIVVTFVSLSQTRQFSLMRGRDGRIRAMSNRNVDTNEYSIVDGKFTANGNAVPWQTRCR